MKRRQPCDGQEKSWDLADQSDEDSLRGDAFVACDDVCSQSLHTARRAERSPEKLVQKQSTPTTALNSSIPCRLADKYQHHPLEVLRGFP